MEHSKEGGAGREIHQTASEQSRKKRSGLDEKKTSFTFFRDASPTLSTSSVSSLFLIELECIRSPSGAPRSSRPARRRRALRRAADERCLLGRRFLRRQHRRSLSTAGRSLPLRCSLIRSIPLATGSSKSAATLPARRRTSHGARSQVRGEKRSKALMDVQSEDVSGRRS